MFIMDIGLKFSFLAESLPGFGIRIWSHKIIWEGVPLFWIIWKFQKEWYQLLFVCLVEFSCEPIWT